MLRQQRFDESFVHKVYTSESLYVDLLKQIHEKKTTVTYNIPYGSLLKD